MVNTSVVPNSKVIRILPTMTNLKIVVLNNQLHKPVEKVTRFFLGQAVDSLNVSAHGEDALPACDRIGANHGVVRFECIAYVVRRAARPRVDRKAVLAGCFVEAWLGVICRQRIKETLKRFGYAVI